MLFYCNSYLYNLQCFYNFNMFFQQYRVKHTIYLILGEPQTSLSGATSTISGGS